MTGLAIINEPAEGFFTLPGNGATKEDLRNFIDATAASMIRDGNAYWEFVFDDATGTGVTRLIPAEYIKVNGA